MSDDKQEMVTISVPVAWAKHEAAMAMHEQNSRDWNSVARACRKALDARKSKYERWREDVRAPWRYEYGKALSPGGDVLASGGGLLKGHEIRLAAAAPDLLDALTSLLRDTRRNRDGEIAVMKGSPMEREIFAAIRKALPEDVADDILGES